MSVEAPDSDCPFCRMARQPARLHNRAAFSVRDGYPVSPGHTLVIPLRHVPTWFDATPEEQLAILELIDLARQELDAELSPDGYNVGFNAGQAAGQTVMHLHVHVIPRFRGDVDDPTGGVRLVIPERGNYRRSGHVPRALSPRGSEENAAVSQPCPREERPPPLVTGGTEDPFIRHLAPLFSESLEVSILAAFVQDSGVVRLRELILSLLGRGGHIRILTGDYLNLTQARALRHLLDLVRGNESNEEAEDPVEPAAAPRVDGTLEVRVVEVEYLAREGLGSSFHPKAWIFLLPATGSAFVGSSNISRAALVDGVEWNLRIDRPLDPAGFSRVKEAFEQWWSRGRDLEEQWLEAYAARAQELNHPLPAGEVEVFPEPPPAPWEHQIEALAALRRDRQVHQRKRALAVLATGLGKTWIAAFDVKQLSEELSRMPRVLFLAHRVEILRQTALTFRRLFPDLSLGWFAGSSSQLEGALVLASVMKLGRKENLAAVPPDAFDYVIVDEVHHADARTYRRILAHLRPRFLLGLTATPERADAGDIMGLFDDHVAFHADIGVGVSLGHLVPFHYFGIKDVVDYQPIPWRNRRFDPVELARAVQTATRMNRLWEAWQRHRGQRTLVFCCSVDHCEFVSHWLGAAGVRTAAVHSGPQSADRAGAMARLEEGSLDALCTVDLFNEGVDLPSLDRVVMLRPTESPVVFLQQLGRGLRVDRDGTKDALTVIDFVGNHRVFLDRVRTLLSLAPGKAASLGEFLAGAGPLELPMGCSMDVELEAIDLLRKLMGTGARAAILQAYRELKNSRGARPAIGELFRMGYNPASLRGFDGWFDFVASENDLSSEEQAVLEHHRQWLHALESREAMTRSFKMVALLVLLDRDCLDRGMSVRENARASHDFMHRSPELASDMTPEWQGKDLDGLDLDAWSSYWERWPLKHWAGSERLDDRRTWFRVRQGRFEPTFKIRPDHLMVLTEMTRELVEYRLVRYRWSRRLEQDAPEGERRSFGCKLIHAGLRPIIRLPERDGAHGIPRGETDVLLPDGRTWRFRFAKRFCNVAHPVGSPKNQLPDLLRGWFGPMAGHPGTNHVVRFSPASSGWQVEPETRDVARVIPFPRRGQLPFFPALRAAAGWQQHDLDGDAVEPEPVSLPVDLDPETHFAVRASGSSMQGWRSEIRDGDWLVMRWAAGEPVAAVDGRVALVARGDPEEGRSYHLKRVRRDGPRFLLVSDNPEVAPAVAGEQDEVLALLVKKVRPEELAPPPMSTIRPGELARAFGLSVPPRPPLQRVDGHLFVMLQDAAVAGGPGVHPLSRSVRPRGIAETAFVLRREGDGEPWMYLGVGRWNEEEQRWIVPDADLQGNA